MELEEKLSSSLYQDLKNKAHSLFQSLKLKKEVKLSEIEEVLNIYDVDPNINSFYLEKCLDYCSEKTKDNDIDEVNMKHKNANNDKKEISVKTFTKNYLCYINSLSLNQKIELNQKIKKKKYIYSSLQKYLNDDSNLEKIYKIFKYIYTSEFNYKELKSIFYTKYFINNEKFHIPLIYGTNELKYSAILNDIRCFLFENLSTNQDTYPENIYLKIKRYLNDSIINEISLQQNLENIDNKKNEDEEKKLSSIIKKLGFLYDLIEPNFDENKKDIFSLECQFKEDDLKFFADGYILNDKLNFVLYNLLYLDLILHCYLYYPDVIKNNIEHLSKMFETPSAKIKIVKKIKRRMSEYIYMVDTEKEKIKCFNMDNKNESFEFNPKEYIMQNIKMGDFQDFQKQFEIEKNFSLYKFYNKNSIFENDNLNEEYKNNISEMLMSDIADQVLNNNPNFKKFKNPFKGSNNKEIINQINRIKYYIFFPLDMISSLTFTKIGIIFINKKFKKMEKTNVENKLINFLINISYKKIIEFHEILVHYMSTLIRANLEKGCLLTPNQTFLNYSSNDKRYTNEYDGGDEDELQSILFGNKIVHITIQSALFILDEQNWNNILLDNFRHNFLEKNELTDKTEIIDLSKESKLIKAVISNFNFNTKISINKYNSFILFRRDIEFENIDYNFIYEAEEEEEEYFNNFSITSNAFISKISISQIINQYGSKHEGK